MRLGGGRDVLDLGRRARTARARRPPSPAGGRRTSRTTPPCSGRGRISRPSSVSRTSPPSAVISVAQRGQPVGLVVAQVGDAAQPGRARRPARRRRRAPASARRRRRGRGRRPRPGPAGDRQPVGVVLDRRAEPAQQAAQRVAGLGGAHRPVRDGDPATGDHGRGQERRGVGEVRLDLQPCRACSGPGSTRQVWSSTCSTIAPAARSISTVISMCAPDGSRPPLVAHLDARRRSAGAASSRALTNCDDGEASRVTLPPSSQPRPCTVSGSRSEVAVTSAPRARRARTIGAERPRRATAGRRRTGRRRRPARPPAAGSASPSRRCRRRPRPVRAAAPAPPATSPADSSTVVPSARSPAAISEVSRLTSGPRRVLGVRASAARTSARLVCDFEPGSRTVAWTGASRARGRPRLDHGGERSARGRRATRAGPQPGRCDRAVRAASLASRRAARRVRRVLAAACWRRAGPARRDRAGPRCRPPPASGRRASTGS